MAAPVDFNGTWNLESSSDNFEELLTALNVGFVLRKAIVNLKPEHIIKQDGDNFHIITKTPIRNQEVKFKVGEQYEQKHMTEDRMNRSIVTWEGDALVTKVLNNDNVPVMTRSLEGGKMKVTQKKGDLEVFRIFVKAEA